MIKLIIFDWDDVITLGSKDGFYECYHKAIGNVGAKLSRKEEWKRIIATWGKSHKVVLAELLKENPKLLDSVIKIYEENFFGETFAKNLRLVRGTRSLLKRLSKKYTLAIATGQHPQLLNDKIIPKYKIPDVFSQIIFSIDIKDPEKQKPHPWALNKIMKDLGFKPEETIFVGDAHSDVKMAQAAGVVPIVVLTGHLTKSEAEKLNVKYIIKDVSRLEKVLEKNEN